MKKPYVLTLHGGELHNLLKESPEDLETPYFRQCDNNSAKVPVAAICLNLQEHALPADGLDLNNYPYPHRTVPKTDLILTFPQIYGFACHRNA